MALMWWKRGKAEQGISASGLCEWLGEGEREGGRTEDFVELGGFVVETVLDDPRLGKELSNDSVQLVDILRLRNESAPSLRPSQSQTHLECQGKTLIHRR